MTVLLRELLDAASDSELAEGLTGRALAEASRRRGRRSQRWASGLGVVILVLGVVAVTQSVVSPSEPAAEPVASASIPLRLPGPDDVPPLLEAPMEAASAAYIVDGELMLVNASTGEIVRAFPSAGDLPASLAGSNAGTLSSPRQAEAGWTTVTLSPDGARALLTVPSAPSIEGVLYRFVYLLDVASGQADRLAGITVPISRDGQGTPTSGLAWSPEGGSMACVCGDGFDSRLRTFEISDVGDAHSVFVQSLPDLQPIEVAWGSAGLAVQVRERRNWLLTAPDGFTEIPMSRGRGLALGLETDRYLVADSTHLHQLAGVPEVPGADRPLVQRAEYRVRDLQSESVELRQFAGSVAGADSLLGGFSVTISLSGALHVLSIDDTGDGFPLTRLPSQTSSVSFAASLVIP